MEEEDGLKHLVHSKPWLLVLLQTWMADRAPLVLPKDHKRRYLDREEDLANQRSAPNAAAVVADRETAFHGLHAKWRRELHAEVIADRAAYRAALDLRAREAYYAAMRNHCEVENTAMPMPPEVDEVDSLIEMLGEGGGPRYRDYVETLLTLVDEHGATYRGAGEGGVLALAPLLPHLRNSDLARLARVMRHDAADDDCREVYYRALEKVRSSPDAWVTAAASGMKLRPSLAQALVAWVDVDDGACVARVARAFEALCIGRAPPRSDQDYWPAAAFAMGMLCSVVEAEIPCAWLATPAHQLWRRLPPAFHRSTLDFSVGAPGAAGVCAACGAEPASSPGLVLMECTRCRDGAFCGRDCQRAARVAGRHPRGCAPFRPEPSRARAAVVRLSGAVARLCRYFVVNGLAEDTGAPCRHVLADLGQCVSVLFKLRAVEAHFEVAAGFGCQALSTMHTGSYSDWLVQTGLPHIPSDPCLVPNNSIWTTPGMSDREVRRRRDQAEAQSRSRLKFRGKLSNTALKSVSYRNRVEPAAQQAHVFSAEVTAAFASAWTARIQDAEVTAPKAAKPLHFPRREPAEDLVEDVDEVLAEIAAEQVREGRVPVTSGTRTPPSPDFSMQEVMDDPRTQQCINDPRMQQFMLKIYSDPGFETATQNPKVIATMQHLMMMQDIHDPGAIREYMLKHVNDPELRPLLEIIARHEY